MSRMKNAVDMIVSDLGDIPSERPQGLRRSNASDVATSLPPAKRKPILPVVPVATSTPRWNSPCSYPVSHSATSTSPNVSVRVCITFACFCKLVCVCVHVIHITYRLILDTSMEYGSLY